ncbi:MAG: O-antigen ligase family protein [Acidimicrobiales bacterium]
MLIALGGVVALGFAAAVIALFVRWERQGKEQRLPLGLLGLLVVEATLYADQNALPRGIFHPGSGATQLRLPEIYITLALIARLIVRGRPKRIGLSAGLWLAFAAWIALSAVVGFLNQNSTSQILYEAKVIVYIVGGYALAAGVPIRRYLDSGGLYRLGVLCIGCASLLDLMTIGKVTVNTNIPLLPLQAFGGIGNETAAIYLAVGTMWFLVHLASGSVRVRHVLGLIPLIAAVVLASERAVLFNMLTVVGVILLGAFFGIRRGVARRFQVGSGQIILTLLAVVAVATVVVVGPAAFNDRPPQIPLASSFQQLFHSQGKQESAQDRLNLAASAEAMIPQHPIIGWGLGVEFLYYETGTRSEQQVAYAHNIVLDLWLRTGIIGVLLFFAPFGLSIVEGFRVWRRHSDPETAALALALIAVLAGLLLTAFLEPMIDEYRLATLFGLSLGMLRATVTQTHFGPTMLVDPFGSAKGRSPAGLAAGAGIRR